MTKDKLERLVERAGPALRHAELVRMVLTFGRNRIQRRAAMAGYTREESVAARHLALIHIRCGEEAIRKLVEDKGAKFTAAVYGDLPEEVRSIVPVEAGEQLSEILGGAGTSAASEFLCSLVEGGDAWFYHTTGDDQRPDASELVLVVRPNRQQYPSSSDLIMSFIGLHVALEWDKVAVRSFCRVVFQKGLHGSHEPSDRQYWRLRAAMRVVRQFFPRDDSDANAVELAAILVMLRLGRLFDIRPFALYSPRGRAEKPEDELAPVVERLVELGFNLSSVPHELLTASEAHDFDLETMGEVIEPHILIVPD